MSAPTESVVINGQLLEGERLAVVTQNEAWSEWILEDGSVLRCRPALVKVLKKPTETGAGYAWVITNVTDIVPPQGKATEGG